MKIPSPWLELDDETTAELLAIKDENEINDRFYKKLSFGTGGLRGIMGAGENRMNRYTVGKATLGIANYIKSKPIPQSVVIAFDSRLKSAEFASVAAGIFAAKGLEVFLFETLVPVPVLSFAVRKLKTGAGIMITASHNPKEYNGYKVYDRTGCQLCTSDALEAQRFINEVSDYSSVPFEADGGKINYVGEELLERFCTEVKKQSLFEEKSDLKIVYTPLHGTGLVPVTRVLRGLDVTVLSEQKDPNGNFPTVRSPNPEEKDALNLAIEKAKSTGADIVLGTDPDCDRVGVAVRHNGEYVLLSGNQVGALLIRFIIETRRESLSEKDTVIKTIVTSELGANIARDAGLNVEDTLTGFKYIGDKINKYEADEKRRFLIGYEESYGYLVGTHARDKDGVVSSMLICQMAAYFKNKGKTLVDALDEIYVKYGYYLDSLSSFTLKGEDGAKRIEELMKLFRADGKKIFTGIEKVLDYSLGIDDLPKENVLKFIFTDGSWIAVRPSGTEPKIKVYFSIKEKSKEQAEFRFSSISEKIEKIINA